MLDHEDNVEYNGHDTEHPLDNVEAVAIEGGFSVTDGLDDVLQDGETSACEIQHNVCD
jgi:phosphoribosylformylglycinamidine (FGAM) synthase-like amidotransferase family enzyme